MNEKFNSIVDRSLPESKGSMLMTKKENGLFSLFMPVTGTGENGSAPEQLEKTVIGNLSKTYSKGRTDNPAITIPFYIHRDNLRVLEKLKGQVVSFMRVHADFTGYGYDAEIDYKLNNTDVGGQEQGEITLTVKTVTGYIDNCYDLMEDTAMFMNEFADTVFISGTGAETINFVTNPADATITSSEIEDSIATATVTDHKLVITGVTAGSTILTLTISKDGYNSFNRTILVIVE